ncbi:MAG: hypothetical protein P8Y73_13130 [Desulfuromonadales bacterium]
MIQQWRRIGEILHQDFGVSQEQIEAALAEQVAGGERLGQILVRKKVLDSPVLAQALARQFDLPCLESARASGRETTASMSARS